MTTRLACLGGAAFLISAAAAAQDTRTVVEPRVPRVCATVVARLPAVLADADESRLDTSRIQSAIDACPAGQGVALRADGPRSAFLSGPLELKRGVTLIVAAGATLLASRDPRVYDVTAGSCGIVTRESRRGCRPLIHARDAAGAAVMGPGTIDGRGGSHLLGRSVSWWDLAEQARTPPAHQQVPRLMVVEQSNDFTLYRVTLKNSANFHVTYSHGDGLTVWGVIIDTPGRGARNTDGIDPAASTNITIAHSFIRTGDDNVAIKAGDGSSSHITIADNHFYSGHGMSIGSETNGGVHDVLVTDLSIDGTDNGLRIKSNSGRGGLVERVVYQNVCIRETKNAVVMDTTYTPDPDDVAGSHLPQFTSIALRHVRVAGATTMTLLGFDAAHPLGMSFDDVVFDTPSNTKVTAAHANVSIGPGAMTLVPSGPNVAVIGRRGAPSPFSCTNQFAPFPAR